MFSGSDSLPIAVATAREQDLGPLLEESAQTLDLHPRQIGDLEVYLHEAWFFGVKTGHRVMVETKMGSTDPAPVVLDMQDEFQDLLEGCAEALNVTVEATISVWNYLGRAWIAGARFWEVEIAARLIEAQSDGFEEALRRLDESD